jgi:hypothetical protein
VITLSIVDAQRVSEVLASLAAGIGSLELLATRRAWGDHGTWRWSILRAELRWAAPVLATVPFTSLLFTRLVAAAWLTGTPSLIAVAWLWTTTLLVNLRFRGTYNGGSDHMLVVVLTGLLVARAGMGNPVLPLAGMAWIAAQGILSYVIAGAAKLRSASWRDGTALPALLAIPAYGVPSGVRRWIANPGAAKVAATGVLAFECAFPLVLLGSTPAVVGVAVAAGFHLANAWVFGLNRFLLTWAATWPAIVAISAITGA